MKVMSRDFTLAEKALLLILALILVGLAYYYFVDIPVRNAIKSSQAEADMLQAELDTAQQRAMYLQGVQRNLDELERTEGFSWMGSYNNSKAEVKFLNDVLADAMKYTINFADVTRNGDQIRRNFTLKYQTMDYAAAQDIMTRLLQGENRCLVGDMRCSVGRDGMVVVDALATFYETMVGGVPDAGLPSDSARAKQ